MAIYCVADLHGRYDLFQMIKDFIKPEDKVYVLGDCGDRGDDGWKIIKEVYTNPQFIYIKGNHEDMLVQAMLGDELLCYRNGGMVTYYSWQEDGEDMSWVGKLRNLPIKELYTNEKGQKIILTHAGYTPGWDDELGLDTEFKLLWGRSHFGVEWRDNYSDVYIVHGHTPIPYMDDYIWAMPCDVEVNEETTIKPGVLWYSPDKNGVNHKCNIDCGAVFTGHTALLDLDTFEQHIFMAEDCIYGD